MPGTMGKDGPSTKRLNFAKLLRFGDLGGATLTTAEEYSLHSRNNAKTNSLSLSEIAKMNIL